jgi:hypothetical protein
VNHHSLRAGTIGICDRRRMAVLIRGMSHGCGVRTGRWRTEMFVRHSFRRKWDVRRQMQICRSRFRPLILDLAHALRAIRWMNGGGGTELFSVVGRTRGGMDVSDGRGSVLREARGARRAAVTGVEKHQESDCCAALLRRGSLGTGEHARTLRAARDVWGEGLGERLSQHTVHRLWLLE